jgi:hypothetical protein
MPTSPAAQIATASSLLASYKSASVRTLKPVVDYSGQAARVMGEVRTNLSEYRPKVRNLANADVLYWLQRLRLLTSGEAVKIAGLDRSLRDLQTMLGAISGDLGNIRSYSEAALAASKRIEAPRQITNCAEYASFKNGYANTTRSLAASKRAATSAQSLVNTLASHQNSIIQDLEAIRAGLRVLRNKAKTFYDGRSVLITAMRVGLYGVWGWRIAGVPKQHWKGWSRTRKDNVMNDLLREAWHGLRDASSQVNNAVNQAEKYRSQIPSIQGTLAFVISRATTVTSKLPPAAVFPTVCPFGSASAMSTVTSMLSSYSGVTALRPVGSQPPWVKFLGVVGLGYGAAKLWSRYSK